MEKKIRVIKKFKDKLNGLMMRNVGDEFTAPIERADFLIDNGYAESLEEIKPQVEVETAVKEVKKEKAVKEKAVKKTVKKETKKNAKK